MKNKGVLMAGLGLGAALTLGMLGLSSANETAAVDSATATNTVTTKKVMTPFGMKTERVMMHGGIMSKGRGDTFMFKVGGPGSENAAAQTALQNNDYAAFIVAIKGSPMEGKMTEEQFAKIVTMEQKRQTIETAIENNDYSAYVTATTPSREEFDAIVAQHSTHKAIEAAIDAKDYAAFQTAIKDTPMTETMTETQFNAMVEKRAEKAEKAAANQ